MSHLCLLAHNLDHKHQHNQDLVRFFIYPQLWSETLIKSLNFFSGSGKSRRKGKAFKIERKMLASGSGSGGGTDHDRDSLNSGHSEYDVDEVKSDGSSGSGKEAATTTRTNGDHHHHASSAMEEEHGKSGMLSGSHVCKFCQIAFMDSIMYTIHMGYHGFQNPYKCNMCGEELEDRVGFFLHIGRNAHR